MMRSVTFFVIVFLSIFFSCSSQQQKQETAGTPAPAAMVNDTTVEDPGTKPPDSMPIDEKRALAIVKKIVINESRDASACEFSARFNGKEWCVTVQPLHTDGEGNKIRVKSYSQYILSASGDVLHFLPGR
ncbi:MAG: hypothetical protein JXA71_00695 [Chitinispirillaceae bacterium]|nr:hypothetical protein [Chitinispirillaceae bacterium]